MMVTPIIQGKTGEPLFDKPGIPVLITGTGRVDLVCGKCESVLIEDFDEETTFDYILICTKCGSYNCCDALNLRGT